MARRIKTSGLGNITITENPKSMTVNVVTSRSTSAGAKLCPKAYEEPQTGHRHEPPIRRICVRELSQCWGGGACQRASFLAFWSPAFGGSRKNKRAARKLSLNPPSWPFYPIPWLGFFTCLLPTTHFPFLRLGGRGWCQVLATHAAAWATATHHEGEDHHHPLLQVAGHRPPSTCTCTSPSSHLPRWANHPPGSGERLLRPTGVTRGNGRGWGRYCTWTQEVAGGKECRGAEDEHKEASGLPK